MAQQNPLPSLAEGMLPASPPEAAGWKLRAAAVGPSMGLEAQVNLVGQGMELRLPGLGPPHPKALEP